MNNLGPKYLCRTAGLGISVWKVLVVRIQGLELAAGSHRS